jgi:hypothetical protein
VKAKTSRPAEKQKHAATALTKRADKLVLSETTWKFDLGVSMHGSSFPSISLSMRLLAHLLPWLLTALLIWLSLPIWLGLLAGALGSVLATFLLSRQQSVAVESTPEQIPLPLEELDVLTTPH